MRMAELARRSGLVVPTIKYYLRAGLLPPGRATARNQAVYAEGHLHRLRLIDTLVSVGGIEVTGARSILAAVGDARIPAGELIRMVQAATPAGRPRGVDEYDRRVAGVAVTRALGAGRPAPEPGTELLDRLIDICAVADLLDLGELGAALEQYVAAARMCAACDEAVLRAYAGNRHLVLDGADPAVREAVVVVLLLGAAMRSALAGLAVHDLLSPLLAGASAGPADAP